MSTAALNTPVTELGPVVEDMSIFLIAGRVKSVPGKGYEAAGQYGIGEFSPVREQAIEAERLGFAGIWLSERFNLKEAGAVLGGAAAVTSRISVGSGAISPASRYPVVTAAIGATINASYGSRFILGLGRGDGPYYAGHGFLEGGRVGYQTLIEYAEIVRALWRGETINYDGRCGKFENLKLTDLPEKPPPIWFVHMGGPRASKIAANPVFDGAMLADMLNPVATAKSVAISREECERLGRDPASLRICQCVVTAPELTELETRALLYSRAVIGLQYPELGEAWCLMNEWDTSVMDKIRAHPLFNGLSETADLAFHRDQLMEVTHLLPDEWMQNAGAIGSIDECLRSLQAFKEVGADEIAMYGSSPAQNAKLLAAWRDRTATVTAKKPSSGDENR